MTLLTILAFVVEVAVVFLAVVWFDWKLALIVFLIMYGRNLAIRVRDRNR